MKILVDLSSAQPQGSMLINGGGEYAVTILMELFKKNQKNRIEVLINAELGDNKNLLKYCDENEIRIKRYNGVDSISQLIKCENYDEVLFPICYEKYGDIDVDDSVRLVTIVHDLCKVYYENLYPRYGKYITNDGMNWLRKFRDYVYRKKKNAATIKSHNKIMHINKNQVIATCSYYSKHSFEHYLDLTESELERIHVFYSPEKASMDIPLNGLKDEILKKYGVEENRFFLLSSACRWAKNNAIAIFVLDKLFSDSSHNNKLSDFKVVVLGADDRYKKYYLNNIDNKDRFVFCNYVSEEEMQTLYANMHLFVFPSILEGFGSPPIEAMKYGKVSACSTAMSMPEVNGDAAIYFDPYDEISIRQAILRSFNKEYMEIKRENVKRRYRWISERRKQDLDKLVTIILQNN